MAIFNSFLLVYQRVKKTSSANHRTSRCRLEALISFLRQQVIVADPRMERYWNVWNYHDFSPSLSYPFPGSMSDFSWENAAQL